MRYLYIWLLDIASDNGNTDFNVTVWDNIINALEENPSVFWIYLFALVGFITVIALPIKFLIKKGREWYNQDDKSDNMR